MENEKKGIKCSYAVLVIILFAALAFVVDYAIIERKMNKCSCPDCSASGNTNVINDDTTVIENKNDSAIVDTSKLKDIALYNRFGHIIVTKDGNVYFKLNEKYNLIDNDILIKGQYKIDERILGPEAEDSSFVGYKVNTSNIRSAYSFEVGNGGVSIDVVLITKDNKAQVLKFYNSINYDLVVSMENFSELSNIVTAVQEDGFGASGFVLYDINGNQYPNGRAQ